MSETLIKVEGVSKKFCRSLKKSLWYGMQDLGREVTGRRHGGDGELRSEEFWAVKDVSFELKRGDCLGLIGHNGAGKTTLLRMLNGLIKPDQGRIEMRGKVGALIALGAGFNPILTGRENIYVSASVLGLNKKEIDSKLEEIIDFAGIDEFIDSPVQSYSSGMQVRLGFAVSTAIEPDVLLIDEVLAVGDANFRSKAYQRIGKILNRCAVIFVTHQFTQLYRICNSVSVLNRGGIVHFSNVSEGLDYYDSLENEFVKAEIIPQTNYGSGVRLIQSDVRLNESGEDGVFLKIQLYVECDRSIQPGLFILNLTNRKGILAAEVRTPVNSLPLFKKGRNRILIELKPLKLARGRYSLDLAFYDYSAKDILIHSRNLSMLDVRGNFNTDAIAELAGEVKISKD